MHFYIWLIGSYILGSIPSGKLIGNLKGIDIQKHGSGNIGFANSLRVMGWIPASFVLICDIAKGYIPVYLSFSNFHLTQILIIGAAAIIGHIFSPWLKFKGGKGVATMLGVTLALNYILGLIAILVWVIVFKLSKISSIASLIVVFTTPLFVLIFENKLLIFYLLILPLLVFTHRRNIRNLYRGKELRII